MAPYKKQNENNVALSFDEVASANKEKIRELLQKKNIVYIYHNQVDARGESLPVKMKYLQLAPKQLKRSIS